MTLPARRQQPHPPSLFDFRCEFLKNPLGIDEKAPRFSWKLKLTRSGIHQTAYQLEVYSTAPASPTPVLHWDSGRIQSTQTHLLPYSGPALAPHTRYLWRVRVWDDLGNPCALRPLRSAPWFETGFLSTAEPPWQRAGAHWISMNRPAPGGKKLLPCPFLRTRFDLPSAPLVARLYITARGLFEPWINGQHIGPADRLVPGWTDYNYRIEYLTYDVTHSLHPGANALGVIMADGWYAGHLDRPAAPRFRHHWGTEPALLAALRIVADDGTVRWISSDSDWHAATGPIRTSEIYLGETHDARLEQDDWSTGAYRARDWKPVALPTLQPVILHAKSTPPIRVVEAIKPVKITQPVRGSYIFDLGQNMVGVVRLNVRAPHNTRLTLRHGEMLNPDGTLYTANLRSAHSTDTYICRGGPDGETWQPRFTFHGFRYVELTGLPADTPAPDTDTVTGIVLHSDLAPIGQFDSSHPLINRLWQNIRWGQRGNFLDVPTDCPQRDERLGWSGDAQVFAPTAACNYDVAPFFRKWLRDLTDGQDAEGAFPDVAPDVRRLSGMHPARKKNGNAAWADAGVICPWVMYQHYGDIRILEENYRSMTRWIDYQHKTSDKLLRPDTAYGDWLAPDAAEAAWAATPCDLIGTAYFAHTTLLMARTAKILRKTADARRFSALHQRIVAAFNNAYVTPDGRLAGDSQTAYLLALGFDLLPQKLHQRALNHLERTFARRNWHLSTGFVGTPLLGPVLTRFGRPDIAFRLLFNESYPSWLMTVKNGATTMWERWDSWTPERGLGHVAMNSFNHYAYGAIGQWLYSGIAGIEPAPDQPGFSHILMRPNLAPQITHAAASIESPHGLIRSSWRRTRNAFTWQITVPAGSRATLYPPSPSLRQLTINGGSWQRLVPLPEPTTDGGLKVQSGKFLLRCQLTDLT